MMSRLPRPRRHPVARCASCCRRQPQEPAADNEDAGEHGAGRRRQLIAAIRLGKCERRRQKIFAVFLCCRRHDLEHRRKLPISLSKWTCFARGLVNLSRSGPRSGPETEGRHDMNIEKYSERVRGFIQSAQTTALSRNHQQFTPEHILKVLIDDDEGLAASLIERAGGTCARRQARRRGGARCAAEGRRRQRPALSGAAAGQGLFDRRGHRQEGRRSASSRSSGCCTALAVEKSAKTADILAKAGVTAQALNQAINDIRKGRTADSASRRAGL